MSDTVAYETGSGFWSVLVSVVGAIRSAICSPLIPPCVKVARVSMLRVLVARVSLLRVLVARGSVIPFDVT